MFGVCEGGGRERGRRGEVYGCEDVAVRKVVIVVSSLPGKPSNTRMSI
jgi:hypothetical protein